MRAERADGLRTALAETLLEYGVNPEDFAEALDDTVAVWRGLCDHCEGTGRIWEPCHVGDAHEYACDCNHDLVCGNCAGTGVEATTTETEPCENCHGTGEVHPTDRPYMSHEIHDCPECGGTGASAQTGEQRCSAPHCWSEYGTPCSSCPCLTDPSSRREPS